MPNEERKITIKGKKATVKGTSVYKNGNYVGQLGSEGLKEDKTKLTGGKTSDSFPKNPKAASKMLDHAAKMSDTDMGIEYRFGKQATADAKAAQQKGNPILKDIEKAKNATKPAEHHTSGMPDFITSRESGKKMNTMNIDEGNFSKITTNIPERSKVTATRGSDMYQKGEEFYVDPAKMHAKHPSMKRMEEMVSKVATYNMPNVKAAQKKYYK